jgi:hypothetical protein
MPAIARQIVYVDTNVVIEAIDTRCWAALLNHFDVRTVAEVRRETQRGDRRIKGYVEVDKDLFEEKVTVEEASPLQIASAQLRSPLFSQIDAGERHLLAYVAAQEKNALLLSTGDRAAVRAACALGLEDRLRSLEELSHACGQKPVLAEWFTKKWLSKVKTEYLLSSF